jgi:hypothetical protein
MFHFGDPVQTARIYLDSAIAAMGPGVEDAHIEELSEQDVLNLLVYSRKAFFDAEKDRVPIEVAEVLIDWHDAVFYHAAMASKSFREKVESGEALFWPVGGRHKENIDKYKRMAARAGLAN